MVRRYGIRLGIKEDSMSDENEVPLQTVHQEELRQIDCEPRYPLGTLGRDVDGHRLRYVKFM